jgi:flagellar protein FlgJ
VSISPSSDIILDVARAADPVKASSAMDKLARLTEADDISGSDFATALETATKATKATKGRNDPQHQLAFLDTQTSGLRAEPDARTKAFKGLEQLVLQNLVATMLPKDSSSIFGHGTAGDIWRSMLADQLAGEIGRTLSLGLTDRILPGPAQDGPLRSPIQVAI